MHKYNFVWEIGANFPAIGFYDVRSNQNPNVENIAAEKFIWKAFDSLH